MKGLQALRIALTALLCPSAVFAQNSLEDIINDITLPHEGRPHGVPESYDWSKGPRQGAQEPPEGWTAAIAWGQLYEWIEGNPATNTRVQIRDMEMYYLSKSDDQWHRLQKARRVQGAAYVEDFAGDVNRPADIRVETDGSISVTAGGGYNYHFWPSSGRTRFPANDVAGCFITVQTRLILDDPDGADDRDQARYLMSVGGDWWLSLTAEWDQWKTNRDMGIGRFRFVGTEWKSHNMISVPVEVVKQNPPPFLSSTAVKQGTIISVDGFRLGQNYPNPFNPATAIPFALDRAAQVSLAIHDVTGARVATLVDELKGAGAHEVIWNGGNHASGLYFCTLQINDQSRTQKLILQK